MNRETCQLDPNTVTEMLNTEKSKPSNQIEMQSNCNWNTTHPSTMEVTLIQEEKRNVEILKRIISEKKTTLPSHRNQD